MNALPSPPNSVVSDLAAYPGPHLPDAHARALVASSCRILDQAPPPTLREILGAYRTKGDGDRDMLLAMLSAKSAEDQRLAATAALHKTMLDVHCAAAAAPDAYPSPAPYSAYPPPSPYAPSAYPYAPSPRTGRLSSSEPSAYSPAPSTSSHRSHAYYRPSPAAAAAHPYAAAAPRKRARHSLSPCVPSPRSLLRGLPDEYPTSAVRHERSRSPLSSGSAASSPRMAPRRPSDVAFRVDPHDPPHPHSHQSRPRAHRHPRKDAS